MRLATHTLDASLAHPQRTTDERAHIAQTDPPRAVVITRKDQMLIARL